MKCYFCMGNEFCFRKVFITEKGEVISPNEFWFCQNVKCPMMTHITIRVTISTQDDVPFYWIAPAELVFA